MVMAKSSADGNPGNTPNDTPNGNPDVRPDVTMGLYEKSMPGTLTLRQKLAETRRAGFDCMEISIDETDEKLSRLKWNLQQRRELVAAMQEEQCPILTMCLSGNRKYPLGSEDLKIRLRGREIMRDAVDFARDIGIRIIQIAGYDEYYQPSNSRTAGFFLESLKAMAAYASREGVMLAFETMETDFLNTVGKAMKYVGLIASPYLQIYPDLGNLTNAAGADPVALMQDLETGRGHIAAMHLKETLPGKFREIPFGTGHVDFTAGIRAALGQGVHFFTAEFWETGNADWKDQLLVARQFLQKKFDAVKRD
jgi:L-ribulose-5-phosphate 3-epimerase